MIGLKFRKKDNILDLYYALLSLKDDKKNDVAKYKRKVSEVSAVLVKSAKGKNKKAIFLSGVNKDRAYFGEGIPLYKKGVNAPKIKEGIIDKLELEVWYIPNEKKFYYLVFDFLRYRLTDENHFDLILFAEKYLRSEDVSFRKI